MQQIKYNAIDETGARYGRLVVLGLSAERKSRKNLLWDCVCDCGSKHQALGVDLRAGSVKSCGCLARYMASARMKKHGKVGTRVYDAWSSMIDRCRRESHPHYDKYGGRGIKVCERWTEFDNFLADMGEPGDGLSLDRIDNDGNYEPSNCRWATRKEQSVNRSITRWIEFNGERLHQADWARRLGVSVQVLAYRIKKFGVEAAMTMKFGRWPKEQV